MRKSNATVSSLSIVDHVTFHFPVISECSTFMTLQFNEMVPFGMNFLAYEDRYSPTWTAEGNVGAFGGHGKSEKQFVCFDRFVRIDGRQSLDLGDQSPPIASVASNTRGDNPASSIACVEARPAGPAPIQRQW